MSANLPNWARGRMRECAICGFWYPERDFRISKRDNKWICKWDYDTLTDEQRAESLKK